MQLIKFLSDKNDHENNDNTLKLTYKWAKKCPADLHGRCPPGCVIGNSKRVRGIPLMPAIIAMELMLYLLREDTIILYRFFYKRNIRITPTTRIKIPPKLSAPPAEPVSKKPKRYGIPIISDIAPIQTRISIIIVQNEEQELSLLLLFLLG